MVTDNDEAVAAVLASTQINDARLRDIASSRGISPRHRPVCWRLLLKYLPMDRREWAASLESNRNNYYSLLNEFKKLPSHEESTMCSSLKAAGIHYESVSITNIFTRTKVWLLKPKVKDIVVQVLKIAISVATASI